MNCMLLCIELAAAGDLEGYRTACNEMLRRFAHPSKFDEAERTLRSVLLLPQTGLDEAAIARLTELVHKEKATFWDELAAGLADYRASRLDSAADWLVRCCARAVVSNRCKSAASAVLAMTEYRRGNVEAAKTALASSRNMISAQWPNGDELNWHAWLMADILCREAEALIR